MRNDNFIDFGEEISRTVRKVLNTQDFDDLKHTINDTMRHIPGMGGNPIFRQPFEENGFPHLSREGEPDFTEPLYREEPQQSKPFSGTEGWYGGAGRAEKSYMKTVYQPAQKKINANKGFVASVLFLVFGFIGAGLTSLVLLVGIAVTSYSNTFSDGGIFVFFGTLLLAFIIMISQGFRLRKRSKRFKLYQRILNGRTFCTVQELSAASGRPVSFIVKDLYKMIKAGFFTEGYLDDQETCLMIDYDTYSQYRSTMENAEKQRKEQQIAEEKEKEKWANHPDGAVLKQTIQEGKSYVQEIKAANDSLPETEVSQKLDQLEFITTQIFDYVEQHPEKLPEIRKFMCYYMPITLKLVKAYQEYELHPSSNGSEVEATKAEIKETLGTINKAYQNLLKKLMQADILDVSSDISALETILAQEGLTEDEFKGGIN